MLVEANKPSLFVVLILIVNLLSSWQILDTLQTFAFESKVVVFRMFKRLLRVLIN